MIFIGGGLGSLFRYFLSIYFGPISGLPIATILANLFASFILGFAFVQSDLAKHDSLKYLVMIGFCGGFSTFSTFSLENFNFIKEKAYFLMMLNIFLNLMLCLAGVFLGINLAKQI